MVQGPACTWTQGGNLSLKYGRAGRDSSKHGQLALCAKCFVLKCSRAGMGGVQCCAEPAPAGSEVLVPELRETARSEAGRGEAERKPAGAAGGGKTLRGSVMIDVTDTAAPLLYGMFLMDTKTLLQQEQLINHTELVADRRVNEYSSVLHKGQEISRSFVRFS
jgi:hypothetical protein